MLDRTVDVSLGTLDLELLDYSLDLAMSAAPLDDSLEDEFAWTLLQHLKTRLNDAHDRLDAS
ncbi:MAG: hypothetical protein IAI48_08090 [Candidatus Eremiobacteraeota bacterium]|nr:hypothetical protein [Candidatus Eremiobacteraeota bacterium]